MPCLHYDVETRSAVDLTKIGARRYAADPSTVVLCVGYAVDDGEPAIWTPGQPVPQPFVEAATNPGWRSVTHNDLFEREIEAQILHQKYDWPIIPLERRRCSMALAQANGLPGSLKAAAIRLGLINQKDQAGHELMLELCDASKPLDPAKLERLYPYCKQDVRTERELYGRLPLPTPTEQQVWAQDQIINARGFAVDLTLAQAGRKIAAEEKADINARLSAVTNGEITTAGQNGRILKYVRERGHTAKSLGKRSVAQILAHDPDEDTRQVLELRRAGGRTSVTKFHTAIDDADADGRIRDAFRYHGSHTGRWAGRSFQPQNLPKVTVADLDTATEAVRSGDRACVRALNGGDTLSIISSVVRNVIIAKPGHILIGADFSAVESRVLAWLAGERWKIDNYRDFDRTGDPKLEPYCVTATRMLLREVTPDDAEGRQQGKTADLALGFGGSAVAWRKFMPDDPRSDEQIVRETVKPWRAAHPAIRRFWNGIEGLFKKCVRTGKPATYGKITAEMVDGALRLTLPSGRCLVYRNARLGPGKFETTTDLYFQDGYKAKQAWYGTIVENIVQGVSRDLLAAAMLRLEAVGFPVVSHCHDEAVCEIPEDQADEARFLELMAARPDWAKGLPLAAKAWISKSYGKSEAGGQADDELDEDTPDELDAILTNGTPTENTEEYRAPTSCSRPDPASTPGENNDKANLMDDQQETPWYSDEEIRLRNAAKHNGAAAGNGHDQTFAAKGNYRAADPDGKPYPPIRAALLAKGYQVTQTFPFAVPGATEPLFCEDRYELPAGLAPTKQRPRKTSRYWHRANGQELNGTGPRRIVYNWPAIMAAGPGATVFITEGANKSRPLNVAGLLATAAPYHKWEPECVSALAGAHVIYLEDHDLPDETGRIKAKEFSADARNKLAPDAASFRVVPSLHLWKNLGRTGEPPHGWDVKDWVEAGGDAAKLLEICQEVPAESKIEPIDLWGRFDPPALPLGLLPDTIERFAVEEGALMGADPSGLAIGALVVCAAALPDHTSIQVKKYDPHWLEQARLWAGLIGNPSTKKTPVILRVAKPLKRLDAELWREYLSAKEFYDDLSAEERKSADRPKQTRLRIEDATIEGAQEVLKDSPDGVLCIQDELSGWFGAMDKYAGHRGAAKDRGFWLQAFNGGPYAINRISRGSALVPNLSISLLGGIQPEPIRRVAEEAVDDGLLQRLLPIVLRPGALGKDEPTSQTFGQRYDSLIEQLHLREPPSTPLHFDDEAQTIRRELEQKHLDLMAYEAINKKLAAHIGKYDGLFARLCLLWHAIENHPGAVTQHTARRVADFMHRFLLPHAFAFYAGMLGLSDDHERLTAIAGYILAHKLERITNRDVQRGDRTMRGLGRHDTENVFHQLDALGWIIKTPGPRPTDPPHWLVNPAVHQLFAERGKREAAGRAKERAMLKEMFNRRKNDAQSDAA